MGKKVVPLDQRYGGYNTYDDALEGHSSTPREEAQTPPLKFRKQTPSQSTRKMASAKYEAVPSDDGAGSAAPSGYPRTVRNDSPAQFLTNYVSTTKYNRFTFLPLAILEQYKKLANVYLLFIAVLCCIPAISPLMPIAAVMPVVFVLSISLVREGMEDYARYQHDEELNNKLTNVRSPGSTTFAPTKWKDVKVGDLIQLEDRDWIPGDVLLLTSSAEGAAFIDTMDLDGETNLKRRSSPKITAKLDISNTSDLDALSHVSCLHVAPSALDHK
jgi:magnesium-transporting ATPase (P-type)